MFRKLQKKLTLQDAIPFLLAFFLPILVMICVFAGKSIFPFGDNSFLRTDMYHQYAPFFSEFYDKLRQGESLSYTWNVGMGSNFAALYGYYLASPLNWLVVLFPKGFIIEFMTYMIVFKIGLSGLFFAVYLSKHHKTKDIGIAFFAVFYALSGYMAAYSWNIMWLDCILLAPLILLGLERLVYEGKGFLYCISLGITILSNYYIAIMVCLFAVLYFIVLLVSMPAVDGVALALETGKSRQKYAAQRLIKICLRFILYSLLAGGLAACTLIPEIFALKMTASSNISFPETWSSYFSVFEMLARHLVNVDVEIGLEHWPNIYCGVAVLLALPLYFLNRDVPYKEKIAKGVLLVFMLFSFATNIPNFIWHGFHYPNSLPCRQSFLYIAVLLAMGYEGYRGLKKFSVGQIAGCFFGGAAFILLAEKLIDAEEFHFYVYYASLALLGVYALLAYLYRIGRFKTSTLALVLMVPIIIETTMNTAVTSVTTTSRSAYLQYTEDYEGLVEMAQTQDPGFYRFEKVYRKTKNDGAWVGYPSASIFSSTANAKVTDIFRALGLEGSTNAHSVNGITPLVYSIFNIKYLLSSSSLDEDLDATSSLFDTQGEAMLYQNLYTLPLGFMVPSDLNRLWSTGQSSPADVQNSFVNLAAGTGDVMVELYNTSTNGSMFEIFLDAPAHVYVEVQNAQVKNVNATIGERTKSFEHVDRDFLLDLGMCYPEDSIVLTTEEDSPLTATAYVFDTGRFIEAYEKLSQQPLEVQSYSDTKITGTVTANQDGMLYTSIPYEDGWTLMVDGEETPVDIIGGAFICVPLKQGEHTIELTYRPAGSTIGFLISINAVAILLLIDSLKRLYRSKKMRKQSNLIQEESDDLVLEQALEELETEAEPEIQPEIESEIGPEENKEDENS